MEIKSESEINNKFKNAFNKLVLLDYDGTLVNLTAKPDKAKLTLEITDIIRRLISQRGTEIFIITGRRHEDIDRFLDHIPINIIAEHGAIIKEDGKWKNQELISDSWKKSVIPVMNQISDSCPGSFIEEKIYSLAWHYRNAESDDGYSSSRELIRILTNIIGPYNLKILDGNKVVEILSDSIGKGRAVKKLDEQNKYDFILSIGDDATDEEMFEYFQNHPNAYTIKVGDGETSAKYKLNDISEVVSLLKKMSG
jgi:trehalose 6-phosphate synthase/phosphatase